MAVAGSLRSTDQSIGAAAMADRNKSVTRLLQHSILQLCNEHIGYSHKLQILGVLCMTVDDEQHELVVKVNNTLKRVNPAAAPTKEIAPAPTAVTATTTSSRPAVSSVVHNIEPTCEKIMSAESAGLGATASSPTLSPAASTTKLATPSRRSHGRKGAKPVKVHHVYDEGELIPDEDSEITTVIPTDPEAETADAEPGTEMDAEEDEVDLLDEVDTPSAGSPVGPASSTPVHSRSSPSQRMLSGGEVKVSGSAKRKTPHQYRSSPQTVTSADEAANSDGTQSSQTMSVVPPSAVRALLMGTGSPFAANGPVVAAQSLGTPISVSGVPVTPICVAPEPDTPENMSATTANGENSVETSTDESGVDAQHRSVGSNRLYVEMNESVIRVKEEPQDDYEYNQSYTMDTSEDYSGPSILPAISADALPSQVPYSGLVLPAGTTVSQLSDGLSIKYTSTGPITVTANGKDASAASKVKDIILYDDRQPLHMQKGSRIETTDYMVDKLGLEGRKRRRRGPEDTLTSEEIAEYMGSADSDSGLFKCSCCTEELNSVTSYLQHTVTVHSAYICHQCGKSFTTKSSLLRHRPIHTGMRRFACSICKKTFYRKDKCKAHIKRHLGANTDPSTLDQYQQVDPIE